MSLADFVRRHLINCGSIQNVHNAPDAYPTIDASISVIDRISDTISFILLSCQLLVSSVLLFDTIFYLVCNYVYHPLGLLAARYFHNILRCICTSAVDLRLQAAKYQ